LGGVAKHRAGDVEHADRAGGTLVTVTAEAQSGVLGAAARIALHSNACRVVESVLEPRITGEPSRDDAALARALDDRSSATKRRRDSLAATGSDPLRLLRQTILARRGRLLRPVLNLQSLNASKLAFIVGDKSESRRLSMRGYPQVVVADNLAPGRKRSTYGRIEFTGLRWKLHYRHQASQFG
jgi:hypothetical protein